jgi:hypothetical protein
MTGAWLSAPIMAATPEASRGPAKYQMLKPGRGNISTSTIHGAFEKVIAGLWKKLTMALTAAARTTRLEPVS